MFNTLRLPHNQLPQRWRAPTSPVAILALGAMLITPRIELPASSPVKPLSPAPASQEHAALLPGQADSPLCPYGQLPVGNIYLPTTEEGQDDTYIFAPHPPCSVPVYSSQDPTHVHTYLNPGHTFATLCAPADNQLMITFTHDKLWPTGSIHLSAEAARTFQTDPSSSTPCRD